MVTQKGHNEHMVGRPRKKAIRVCQLIIISVIMTAIHAMALGYVT